MSGWVALLRGINVGGNNKVPMADLRKLAVGLGWTGVKTYIASGNLVFQADGKATDLAAKLHVGMKAQMGVNVSVMVQSRDVIRATLAACPYHPEQGKHVHVIFLFSDPVVDQAALAEYIAPSEHFTVDGRLAWLHAPEGVGRSKLVEKLHKVLVKTETTARNLNTLRTLAEMLD